MLWIESPILKNVPSPMLLPNSLYKSPFNSPLLGSCRLSTNNVGGELLLGYEASNGRLFRSLSDQRHHTDSSGSHLSVASDYKYEGLMHSDRMDHDLNCCLNTLRVINGAKSKYDSKQLCLDKLNEMENIIKSLKNKIKNDDDEEKSENTNHEHQELNESDDGSEQSNDSSYSLISGVKLMETPTPENKGNDVQYYDFKITQ